MPKRKSALAACPELNEEESRGNHAKSYEAPSFHLAVLFYLAFRPSEAWTTFGQKAYSITGKPNSTK